jgi:hypothetical protein
MEGDGWRGKRVTSPGTPFSALGISEVVVDDVSSSDLADFFFASFFTHILYLFFPFFAPLFASFENCRS